LSGGTIPEDDVRILPLLAALTLLTAGSASAQTAETPPNNAAPARGTGQGNDAVNPNGNVPSSVNASGTIRMVSMADLAKGANSFTEGQARSRIAGAGFGNVTALTKDENGVWRGHAEHEGRTVDVGFDYKGQIAFQ
jgi:putative membrane protein